MPSFIIHSCAVNFQFYNLFIYLFYLLSSIMKLSMHLSLYFLYVYLFIFLSFKYVTCIYLFIYRSVFYILSCVLEYCAKQEALSIYLSSLYLRLFIFIYISRYPLIFNISIHIYIYSINLFVIFLNSIFFSSKLKVILYLKSAGHFS